MEDAVFPPLDHDAPRTHAHQLPGRLDEVEFARQLPDLRLVDDDDVDVPDHFPQQLRTPPDPEVHRVERDDLRFAHLGQDVQLQFRIDVPEEDVAGFPVRRRKDGGEILEHVQVRFHRVGDVQVVLVIPLPMEGDPIRDLQPLEVDPPGGEHVERPLREIPSHDRDEAHGRQVARRQGEVGRRPADHAIHLAEGRLDAVERHRPDDQKAHASRSGIP